MIPTPVQFRLDSIDSHVMFPFWIPMFWNCSFCCMFRTPDFPTFAFCDFRYMFYVSICHSFSMFPLCTLCFIFSLFSDSAVSTSPYLVVFLLMFSVPLISCPIPSELLENISLVLVLSSLRTNITYSHSYSSGFL